MACEQIVIEANKGDILRDLDAPLFGNLQHTVGHLVIPGKNRAGPGASLASEDLCGALTPTGNIKTTVKNKGRVRRNPGVMQSLDITLIAFERAEVMVRTMDIGDAPVSEFQQVPGCFVGAAHVINPNPGDNARFFLVIDHDQGQSLVETVGDVAGEFARQNRQ